MAHNSLWEIQSRGQWLILPIISGVSSVTFHGGHQTKLKMVTHGLPWWHSG